MSDDIFKVLMLCLLVANGQGENSLSTRLNEILIPFMLMGELSNSRCGCGCGSSCRCEIRQTTF